LEVDSIHTYYGASHILNGVNLRVEPGESLSLMGRNGMGKTTTIRTIFGLTPAVQGTVSVFGRDVSKSSPNQIARAGLALVPEGRGIFPNLSVKENLVMAARPGADGSEHWTLDRVLALFPRLAQRLPHLGTTLSGGEQQMLSIGRALLTNPTLLVLDEATEGLAPLVRQEIWTVLSEIKDAGVATIVVDKDLRALLAVCDRSMILAKGRVVFEGTAQELANNPEVHRRHLGV
jgi:branched-chain amino acid transport system ATP-binding protein